MRLILYLFFLMPLLVAGCRPTSTSVPAAHDSSSALPVEKGEDRLSVSDDLAKPLALDVDRTPLQVLQKMVAAYKAAHTYNDHGVVRMIGDRTEAEQTTWPCTVVLQKPGKLRLEINEGMLVSDGVDGFAQIRALPGQILSFSTPATWSFASLFQDMLLDRSMELGIPETILHFPPQLVLLWAVDPLKTLYPEGSTAEFMAPQWLNESPCDLVRIIHPGGTRILWINRRDGALLRFDYQVEMLSVQENVESVRLIRIDLTDAGFDREIAPEAFQMLKPADARTVTEFQPVETCLLGKPLDHPESLRLESLAPNDDASVSLDTLSEKTVVLCFWTSWSEPSRAAMIEMLKVRNTLLEDDRVRFYAVNPDLSDSQTDAEHAESASAVRETLARWNLSISAQKDGGSRLTGALDIDSFPTTVVLAPKSRVEFLERGIVPAPVLGDTVREILAGGKPHERTLALLSQEREDHRTLLRKMTDEDCYALPVQPEEPPLLQKAAPPKPSSTFSLVESWSLNTLTSPGNIAVLPGKSKADGTTSPTLLLVPCDGNSLAILDLSGNLVQKFKPTGLRNDELLTLVRTGVDGIGNRYIGVSSVSGRAVHVFDDQWKPVLTYSPGLVVSPLEASRPEGTPNTQVVSDFRLVDIYGNGTPALLVGVVGLDSAEGDSLRAVDFQGREIWRDDTVSSPFLLDLFVDDGKRGVFCLDVRGQRSTLLKFDAQGKRWKPFQVDGDRQVFWFDVANLDDDVRTEICAILGGADGEGFQIAGLDFDGGLKWSQPLPFGKYQYPIDQIYAGNLTGDACKEWLVPTPDGSVFVFDRQGTLIDTFAFGEYLSGLAVVAEEDKHLLIVVEKNNLTAWDVESFEP